MDREADEILQLAHASAHKLRCQMTDERQAFKLVKRAMAEGDLVIGVWEPWPSPETDRGWMVVKGNDLLREIEELGHPLPAKIMGIPCVCYEQAEALRLMLGDGREVA